MLKYAKEYCEYQESVEVNKKSVLLNIMGNETKSIINTLLMITKNFIYGKRCKKEQITMKNLLAYYENARKNELYATKSDNKLCKYYKKWYGKSYNDKDFTTKHAQEYLMETLLQELSI